MLDIDASEARAKAATPGPWGAEDPEDYGCGRPCTVDGCHDSHPRGVKVQLDGPELEEDACGPTPIFSREEDAKFIAHAREDNPALIAELRKLREESRWIPVTEWLPYEGESVLLTWGGHVLIGYHHERSDGFYSVFERVDDVTHWRPLPKPPEVG